MSDIFTKRKRSEIMSHIKSKNTSIETSVFSFLSREHIAFKKHYKKAIGTPDIAIPSSRHAVFIDSDFWHGWQYPRWKSNLSSRFWKDKIENNRNRDRYVTRKLRQLGWQVLRVWEHEIKRDNDATFRAIKNFLTPVTGGKQSTKSK